MSAITVTFSSADFPQKGSIAVLLKDGKMGAFSKKLDKATKGSVAKALKVNGGEGKAGETVTLHGLSSDYDSVTFLSLGKLAEQTDLKLETAGSQLFVALSQLKGKDVSVVLDFDAQKDHATAAFIASGARLRSYRFDKYRTTLKAKDKPTLATLTFFVDKAALSVTKKAYSTLEAVADGVHFARDLMNEPANVLSPEQFATRLADLKKIGLKVTVLKPADLKKLKMGALLAVGQASAFEPRVVALEWNGDTKSKSKAPLALMGKGVTFDTGGLALKTLAGMVEMKYDMGGAAAVVGTMMALALRKAKANVVGVVGLVENAVAGNATRPSDVVTSMSGQTIEIVNTDAEGRLVLADILTYTQRTFKPSAMIDVATLTGAMIVTFGAEYAGLMSNDDKLSDKISDSGRETGELVWRLPLNDAYDPGLNSSIADMKNMGYAGEAGSIAAAMFIKRFVENKTTWAHLDIVGPAWISREKPIVGKGAAGYGVRLLNRLVADHFEPK